MGHTAAHWPQKVQTDSSRGFSKAGATTEEKPRFTPERAPTVWTSLHMVSQRRHMTHLSMSRSREGEWSFT